MKNRMNTAFIGLFAALGVVSILGLILGSFFDFELSKSIVNVNDGFSSFFESFGACFGYLMGTIGGTLMFMALKDNPHKIARLMGWGLLIGGIVVCTYLYGEACCIKDGGTGLRVKPYIAYPLSLLINGLVATMVYFLFGSTDHGLLFKVGLAMVIVLVTQLLLVNLVKLFAQRPRYRLLLSEPELYSFKAWWEWSIGPGHPIEDLRSFPSSHVSTAASVLSLPTFALLVKENKKRGVLIGFSAFSFIYVIVLAYTRVKAGAHFLSDVCFGALTTSIIGLLTSWTMFGKVIIILE